jgi:hypothetical protein
VAWLLAGTAVIAWGIGNTVWTFTVADMADPPFPSYADIGFLSVYPPAYAAILLLLRGRVGRLHTSLWLDGAIGALAVAAVGTAVVFQAVLKVTGGSPAAVATNLAYPLADLTLIALVVWALGRAPVRPRGGRSLPRAPRRRRAERRRGGRRFAGVAASGEVSRAIQGELHHDMVFVSFPRRGLGNNADTKSSMEVSHR